MKIICAVTVLTALLLSPAYAACVLPAQPANIPDGATATSDDMLAAQQVVLTYNNAATAYLDCITKEYQAALAAAGDQITTVQRDKLDGAEAQEHSIAVSQIDSVVNNFNEQMRIFIAKGTAAKNAASAKANSKKK